MTNLSRISNVRETTWIMSKYKNSNEAIDSSLMLWPSIKHTNTSVSEVYDLFIYPLNSIIPGSGQTISFNVPPQETGLLLDIEVVTKFHIKKGSEDIPDKTQVSIVNNIASAMFSLVEVRLEDRINLLQQMSNSYNLCTFFETVLNNELDREDILFARQLFVMDEGSNKTEADKSNYIVDETHLSSGIKNKGAQKRAIAIASSATCTVMSKLNVPLFNQHKGILPNTRITITFTTNKSEYCIMADEDDFILHIDDMYLKCTFMKPQATLLNLINEKLARHPVIYESDKQLLLARLLPAGSRYYTINNMFEHQLPKLILFTLQHPESMTGKMNRNVFTFYPIKSLQLYINNKQHFPKPLTNAKRELLDQIYKSTGRDLKGSCLINGRNLVLNQFYVICLTDDRTFGDHYSIKRTADTRLEVDLGEESQENFVLLAYCLYDIQISIDGSGNIILLE